LLVAFCVIEAYMALLINPSHTEDQGGVALIRTKGALIFNQTTKGAHIKEGRDQYNRTGQMGAHFSTVFFKRGFY